MLPELLRPCGLQQSAWVFRDQVASLGSSSSSGDGLLERAYFCIGLSLASV